MLQKLTGRERHVAAIVEMSGRAPPSIMSVATRQKTNHETEDLSPGCTPPRPTGCP